MSVSRQAPEIRTRPIGAFGRIEMLQDATFNELVQRSAGALGLPMAALSFFDRDSEWFKACHGIRLEHWALQDALFRIGTPQTRVQCIGDLALDARGAATGLTGPHAPRSWLGAAVLDSKQEVIGVLSVFASTPRDYSQRDMIALSNLADLVSVRLATRSRGKSADAPAPLPAADVDEGPLAAAFVRLNNLLEEEISTRKATEEQLRREKEFSDAAISSLPGAFYMFKADGKMLRWNVSFTEASGYSNAEVAQRSPLDFIVPEDREQVANAIRRVFAERREISVEARFKHSSGQVAPYLFTGKPLDFAGETVLIGVGRDITERKRVEQQMVQAKQRLDLALASSRLALWDWDLLTNTVYFNEGWAQIIGAPAREVIIRGSEVLDWNHPEDREAFTRALTNAALGAAAYFTAEYRIKNENEEWIWIFSRGKVTERDADGKAVRMTGTSENITARKLAEERAEFLATRDTLTGLPNRMLLNDRLEQGIAGAARAKSRLAFMFIDLDRFKNINDSLGHHVGDELLKQVAARLASCVRATDTVARLGGDEFAVILEDLKDEEGAQTVAESMITALAAPIFTGNLQLNTSCSIGIGMFPEDGRDSATLMKNADAAMYHAKEKGRNNYQFFSADMNAKVLERLSVENYLRLALRRNELVLHYQPRVSFETGEMVGVEALLRWQHPRHGLILPDKFLSVAEDSGLIVSIGEWVLKQACTQVKAWQQRGAHRGLSELKVSVNLAPGQARDANGLLRAIDYALSTSGLNARFLELELTETVLMKNTGGKERGSEGGIELLHQLGQRGVSLSIDDFGTGYSSLYYLKSLPVDSVKIDGSFVHDIVIDPNDEAIIRAIVAMSHSMQLKVVAEAVETDAQFTALKTLGCDEYHGCVYAKPLSVEEFEQRFLA
jgi:diguanylate cyclase (GGDEF)-like protein/PAS domain S-box-containing protein